MTAPIRERLRAAQAEISDHLENGIMKFWLEHGIDHAHGGYLTGFDEGGRPSEGADKYVVTQTRMIWGFSRFASAFPASARLREAAKQGVDFFLKSFWDAAHGGVCWSVARDGRVIDAAKLVYGQSFAVYALSEYGSATGDPRGLQYSEAVFDLLQKYSADTYNGGYFENLESDWRIAEGGAAAGDRKSLDIHMHLMEAFTGLYQASRKPIHARKLEEVIAIILDRMISKQSGCGLNQFDVRFNPRPAINIKRTWNAERKAGEVVAAPADTTSYGHNIELLWLLNRAGEALGRTRSGGRIANPWSAFSTRSNISGMTATPRPFSACGRSPRRSSSTARSANGVSSSTGAAPSSAATSEIPGRPSITPAARCSSAPSGCKGCAARRVRTLRI